MFEDDDMRLVFLDDFGEEVTFTPNAGDPFTCQAIFDARPTEPRAIKGAQVGYDEGAQVHGNSPQLRCRSSDLVDRVKAGRATATVRGNEYNIFAVKPDNTGMSLVVLREA
jgi:hypothetical protein